MADKHKGFKATQKEIASKQNISQEAAGAILASAARKASPEAIAKNTSLANVSGMPKEKLAQAKEYTAKEIRSMSDAEFEKNKEHIKKQMKKK